MKNIFFLFSPLMILTSFACNNDDDGPATPLDDCSIVYTIDGQTMTENDIVVCALLDGTLNLGLIGSNNIQIQVNELDGPGTFTIADNDVFILVDLDDGTRLGAESGTVTVDQLTDSKATGTFSLTLRDINDFMLTGPTVSLTNGQFNASF
ncbi:MAG: hypothetical protein AAFN81_10615 [Bacteroidota bacterium]